MKMFERMAKQEERKKEAQHRMEHTKAKEPTKTKEPSRKSRESRDSRSTSESTTADLKQPTADAPSVMAKDQVPRRSNRSRASRKRVSLPIPSRNLIFLCSFMAEVPQWCDNSVISLYASRYTNEYEVLFRHVPTHVCSSVLHHKYLGYSFTLLLTLFLCISVSHGQNVNCGVKNYACIFFEELKPCTKI